MERVRLSFHHLVHPAQPAVLVAGLLAVNLAFNILANASFKISAFAPSARGFLTWQVIGNLAGFLTVLTLTWLLRFLPLSIAFPVTTGLAVLGVELAAGSILFREPISSAQWVGTAAIVVGIFLVSRA